jgi:hypothetical protein
MTHIDPNLIRAACADGDQGAIEEFSTTLSSNLAHREILTRQGETHLVARGKILPDSLISNFAYRMLRACGRKDLPPPAVLVDLMQRLLKQDRPPQRSERRYVQRMEAINHLKEFPGAGVRAIARAVGVRPSTVSRWKKQGKI